MIKFSNYCLVVFLVLVLSSCKNKELIQVSLEPAPAIQDGGELSNNQARVIAQIISVIEVLDTEGPCSKAPCNASIRIKQITRKGSLFQLNDIQDTIAASFAFTLSQTDQDLFPGLKTKYPGLKINDIFEATIESRIALNEEGVRYIIYDYKKMNDEK